jgi:hypothetical protein
VSAVGGLTLLFDIRNSPVQKVTAVASLRRIDRSIRSRSGDFPLFLNHVPS